MSRAIRKYQHEDQKVHRQEQARIDCISKKSNHSYGNRICARRIFAAGIADQWRFCLGTLGWIEKTTSERFSLCISDKSTNNAWAVRNAIGSQHHLVIITSSCLLNIQSLAKIVFETLCLMKNPRPQTTLHGLFGQNPDVLMLAGLTQAITMATTNFLLMHEAAHIIRGHHLSAARQALSARRNVNFSRRALPASSSGSSAVSPRHANVVSKVKEFDADLHACLWTKVYFDHNSPATMGALGSASEHVHRTLLGDHSGRRYLALMGGLCFHLSLSGSADRTDLAVGSHPSRHDRVQLTYLSDYALSGNASGERSFMPECIRFASALVVVDGLNGGRHFPNLPIQLTSSPDGLSNVERLKIAAQWLGSFEDGSIMDELQERRIQLMKAMPRLALQFTRNGVKSQLPLYQWWIQG